ncbi:MAG: TonB-dependent siderophore receptor [Steroidobacter sp.]
MALKKSLCTNALLLVAIANAAGANARTQDLEEILVEAQREHDSYAVTRTRSATKTDTPLRDVPQSVSVVTARLIQDQSMQNLADVARYVPGAGMAQGEGNRDTIILRGNSSTADFFVDGVRDDVEYFRDIYNVNRVEVLKGPSAMIFGRGGAGGVVNRVTRQAGWDRVGEVSLQGGSWNNGRVSADLGGPVNDRVAARVTGMYEDSESYRDGVKLERHGINPTAAVQLSDNTQLRLGYEYYDYDRTADRGIPSLSGRPYEVDESTFFGDPDKSPTDATVNIATVVLDHNFSDTVSLRNRTLYGDYNKFYQNVFPGAIDATATTVAISAYNNEQLRENIFNQTDLLFSLDSGPLKHRLLAGAEFGRQVTDNFRNTGYFNDTTTTVQAPLSDPTISVPVTFRQSETDADNHGEATVAALYIQDQVEFSQHFQAVLGVRYDRFEMDFRNNRTGDKFESSDDLFSPRVGLIYKPTDPLSIYASYSKTYAPRSGAQMTSLNLTNESLDPEEFENVELGMKWDARENLSLTAAVFQLDRTNVVIPDPNDPTLSILVDGQRTEGVELGVSGQISEAWSIQGGYAYQDGELTAQLGGNRLAQLPKHVASLWNKYDFGNSFSAGLGIIHQTEMFAAADNLVTLPGFTRVDAALFYRLSERLRMQVNVENLLDEQYYANAHSNNNITPGSPVAVRASLTANF